MAKAITAVYGSPPESRPLPIKTKLLIGTAAITLLVILVFVGYLVLQVLLAGR
jgi:hypothetical protein